MMTSRKAFTAVVYLLGAVLILSVVGVVVLTLADKPVDDILKQVIVGCITGLAGLLARTPTDEAADVKIVNEPSEPVPVDNAPDVGGQYVDPNVAPADGPSD
jgi:hypothetical protein